MEFFFSRENKFEHSTKDRLLKPGIFLSNKPNLSISKQISGQPFHHFERIGREIRNFRLPGLPSLKDIQNHFDMTQDRKKQQNILHEKNETLNHSLKILIDLKHILKNSTTIRISGLRNRIDEFTDTQMSAIQNMIREITPLTESKNYIEELIKFFEDPANVLTDTFVHFDQQISRYDTKGTLNTQKLNAEDVKIIEPQKLKENKNFIERKYFIPKSQLDHVMNDFDTSSKKFHKQKDKKNSLADKNNDFSKSLPSSNSIFDFLKPPSYSQADVLKNKQTETKSPLDSLFEGLERPELRKLKALVDKTVAGTSNMAVFRDTLDTLGSISGDTLNNTQLLIKNIIPIDQIGADVSRVAEYLLDNSSSIPEKVLNARSNDFENLHFFHHLKNASDTFAGIRLLGLPSVRELSDIESFKLPEIVLPNFFDNNNNEANQILKQAPRNLLNASILMDNKLYIEGEKGNEKRNTLNVTSKNETSSAQILNIEVPSFQLPELPILPNLDNIVAASKVIPHLIPFVVADYKVKVLKLNKRVYIFISLSG